MTEHVLNATPEVDDLAASALVIQIFFDSRSLRFDFQQRLVLNPEIPKLFVLVNGSTFQTTKSRNSLFHE
ncbi:hypothetical protein QLX08_007956 [Tetragonisca angustula]|uniref:Uncharacterized protein n=1 Tax=Tetragonisca angustula TaxID=166442 RepID=A0AAW0ZN67_9HYME